MQYRPEIDGLRAIAVAAVVLFHGGFAGFSGGYVGVDVFFVISGYLIAGLIAQSLADGRFSILDFYERRARRILPALFVVIAATLPLAWASLLPGAWQDYLQSVLATVFFGSNLLYWSEAGYFDTATEEKPLLHTWSLAVEEQYYLLFPLAMILLWRFGPRRVAFALGGVALASFLAAEWLRGSVEARFYLAPFRAWEFLAGALCAFVPRLKGRWAAWLAPLGLAAILGPVAAFGPREAFPSAWTALPVAGATLVVLGGHLGWARRVLAAPPLVGLGLISYSLYLWHQPIFVFARMNQGAMPSVAMRLSLIGLAVLLAHVTWSRVEQPFRRRDGRLLAARARLFAGAALGGAGLAAAAVAGFFVHPWLQIRFPDLARPELLTGIARPVCPGATEIGDTVRCRVYGHGPFRVAVWGDSHAKVIEQALIDPAGMTVWVLSNKGCPPILGVWRPDGGKNAETCADPALTAAHAALLKRFRPDRFVLVGRWSVYLNGWIRDGVLQPSTHFLTDGRPGVSGAAQSRAVVVDRLSRTIADLAAVAPVSVVMQVPDQTGMNAQDRIAARPMPRAARDAWHGTEAAVFDAIARRVGFDRIETADIFCDAAACASQRDGLRLYIDDNHLTVFGARLLWQRIEARVTSEETAALQR